MSASHADADDVCICAGNMGCGWSGLVSEAVPSDDIEIDYGMPVPVGRCPECDSHALPAERFRDLIVLPEQFIAIQTLETVVGFDSPPYRTDNDELAFDWYGVRYVVDDDGSLTADNLEDHAIVSQVPEGRVRDSVDELMTLVVVYAATPYDTEAWEKAYNAVLNAARDVMTKEQHAEWERRCVQATSDECVIHALEIIRDSELKRATRALHLASQRWHWLE